MLTLSFGQKYTISYVHIITKVKFLRELFKKKIILAIHYHSLESPQNHKNSDDLLLIQSLVLFRSLRRQDFLIDDISMWQVRSICCIAVWFQSGLSLSNTFIWIFCLTVRIKQELWTLWLRYQNNPFLKRIIF